jgi:hypothetical protein
MSSLSVRRVHLGVVAVFASAMLAAQDVPLTNWTVRPYRASGSSGGLSPMTDISPGVGFTAMQPCRVVDTRGGGGFTGAYGPPIMAANAIRSFDIDSAPHCTGIPSGVEAYSLNFTVTQTAGPTGDIRVWPTGNPPVQITSVLNWTVTNAVVANATIMPAGTNGSIDVQVAGSNTHLLIDINGYFTDQQNSGQSFVVIGSTSNAVIIGINNSTAGAKTSAIFGSGAGETTGVLGTSLDGAGVLGFASGTGDTNHGVFGITVSPATASTGVLGTAQNSSGQTYGVAGHSDSDSLDSAGVRGSSDVLPNTSAEAFWKAGVRGESKDGYGVLGLSELTATSGYLMNAANGAIRAAGHLGADFFAAPQGAPPWGVFAEGDIGATGTKHFLDPHPTDPTKAISYVSLEGPEAGTYFRGRGKFQNGIARVAVPEHFRLVTDPEGLSVQVTPIGAMATVAIMKADLEQIVVQSSRDVEFYYQVQGVRSTFKDMEPITSASPFLPESVDRKMPEYLSPGQKRRLIENGTYNADGTVNVQTARRLGWDRVWEKRAAQSER